MKIIVTGGAGFIGKHLVRRLLGDGHRVASLDEKPESDHVEGSIICIGHTEFGIPAKLRDADCVVHLAAQTDQKVAAEDPLSAILDNVEATVALLQDCVRGGPKRFVYASSWTVYGHPLFSTMNEMHPPYPLSPYALTKLQSEQWCQMFAQPNPDLEIVILRVFNVYGPGCEKDVVGAFVERKKKRQLVKIMGDGSQTRDFVHVSDVCEAFVKAVELDFSASMPYAEGSYNCRTVNMGTGVETSVLEVARLVGAEVEHVSVPEGRKSWDARRARASTGRARALLGWEAQVGIKDGIREMINAG